MVAGFCEYMLCCAVLCCTCLKYRTFQGNLLLHLKVRKEFFLCGHAVTDAASRRFLIEEARVCSHVRLCDISDGTCGTGTGLSPSTSVVPCHYHSTLSVSQYPVRVTVPMLHTHSFFHHRRYATSPVGTTPLSGSKVLP